MSVIGPVQSWNRKQNKVCVTLDSELYRRKPVLTYAISGYINVLPSCQQTKITRSTLKMKLRS